MLFPQAAYYRQQFSHLEASKEIVSDIEFEDCKFSECSFIDCEFIRCSFINCHFNDCVFSAIKPTNCRLTELFFTKCKVIGFDWTRSLRVQDLSFTSCQLNYSNFRMLKLPRLKVIDCEVKEADFFGSDLSEADFSGTDLERTIFSKTNLTKVNFSRCKNYFIDVRSNTVKKAKFSLPEAISLLDSFNIIIN